MEKIGFIVVHFFLFLFLLFFFGFKSYLSDCLLFTMVI